jgi:uncharacterized sporulation protein YeaH/YhbH (DUF444 family)
MLLYLFLTRNYERIEVVFIRHHTGQEVDEDDLLHTRARPAARWCPAR